MASNRIRSLKKLSETQKTRLLEVLIETAPQETVDHALAEATKPPISIVDVDLVARVFGVLEWTEVLQARVCNKEWKEAAEIAEIQWFLVAGLKEARQLVRLSSVLPNICGIGLDCALVLAWSVYGTCEYCEQPPQKFKYDFRGEDDLVVNALSKVPKLQKLVVYQKRCDWLDGALPASLFDCPSCKF
ncbi:unknown protein [Seminavis robusta]|uniref:F-box domain-containing protein n=1 Tax=Seminavis robusta TaxID=568900 RepID=A0A9N8HX76_9STRA|nr:unknown protein [Seminavis robusta]|eukprot:Sro2405_g326490.1 n/a (188) ;mRNA; r:6590-7153